MTKKCVAIVVVYVVMRPRELNKITRKSSDGLGVVSPMTSPFHVSSSFPTSRLEEQLGVSLSLSLKSREIRKGKENEREIRLQNSSGAG